MGCWRIDVDSMRKAGATLGTTDVSDIVEIHTLDSPSGVVLRLVLAMFKIRTLIVMFIRRALLDCSCNNANYQNANNIARVLWSLSTHVLKKANEVTRERKDYT